MDSGLPTCVCKGTRIASDGNAEDFLALGRGRDTATGLRLQGLTPDALDSEDNVVVVCTAFAHHTTE